MKIKIILLIFVIFITNTTISIANDIQTGDTYFKNGNFHQAIEHWEYNLSKLDGQVSQRIDILTRLAAAYQAAGKHRKAFDLLEEAVSLTKQSGDTERSAIVLSQLSDIWLSNGDAEEALLLADNSLNDANETKNPSILARATNSQGNALAILEYYPEAMKAYESSILSAKQAGDFVLATKATINRLNAAFFVEPLDEVMQTLQKTWQQIQTLPDNRDKAAHFISMGTTIVELLQDKNSEQLDNSTKKTILSYVYTSLSKAADIAKTVQDNYAVSVAYGRLGELHEIEKHYAEALHFTRQAIFYAKQGYFPHILYRWYWIQGRVLKIQQKFDLAIDAFRLASDTVKPIQQLLEVGYRRLPGSFDEVVKPVHYGLADLLLQKAENTDDVKAKQELLLEVVEKAELVKVAELQDYFQDECITILQDKNIRLDRLALPNIAILYPLALPDRLIVLVNIDGTFYQKVIPVSSEELNEVVWNFRLGLQTRPNNRFLHQAKQLYDWLIRPIESYLADVDTIVVVPDGKLRMIPLSTLYDGSQFLIEKYAMVLTPGLKLVSPQSINWNNGKILLVGLSDAVQEYPPLPNVPMELDNIRKVTEDNTAGSKTLLNKEYLFKNFHDSLKTKEYNVIHLATHG
ncbi:MAG: CHAT domain-containing protein, partial [Candidatus Marithrix sp.]|nr:CHAT domain-containing protein [Candidatus Marithrix sp.]